MVFERTEMDVGLAGIARIAVESEARILVHMEVHDKRSCSIQGGHSWWNTLGMMDRFTSIHFVEENLCYMKSRVSMHQRANTRSIRDVMDAYICNQVLSILIRVIERRMKGVASVAGKMWRIVRS